MKKITRRIVIFMCLAIAVSAIFSTALACTGYGSRNYYGTSSKVYAYISRCSCTPVDNHLYASTKAQYLSGDQYYWTNWNEQYGYDVSSKSSTTKKSNIVFGYCHFRWECNTGDSGYHLQQFNVTP